MEKSTELKTNMKYRVNQFLKLDLNQLPIWKIRELLCYFNSEVLKIHKNRKKLFRFLRKANEYCFR